MIGLGHTWPRGQAGAKVRWSRGHGRLDPRLWAPTPGYQPPLALSAAPLAPGLAPQPPCCPLAWPSSHPDWSVCIRIKDDD